MRIKCTLIALLLCVFAAQGHAATITFANGAGNLAASAVFETINNNLIVTLTNTSSSDVMAPKDVLTAVFFSGANGLTPVSAVLAPGSTVYYGSTGGGNVGGEWAYASGLSGAPLGATAGISSSGFGLFGNGNFSGPDLSSPLAINGLNYGITSAGDNPATGNAKVTGGTPLIYNSVVFTLSGLSGTFNLGQISNVSFQYGTSLSEPNVPVPEPGTMVLLGTGLVGLAGWGRKRFRK